MAKRKSTLSQKLKWLKLRALRFTLLSLLAAVAATNSFAESLSTIVVAHGGVHNPFSVKDLNCGARRRFHVRYPFIEGTRESIAKAFEAGADVVEIDLRLTKDNQIVLFHDDDVSCRTNGKGRLPEDFTLADMRKLDVAYHISADDGKTNPWRGTGVGKIMTLGEVYKHFPGKMIMYNPKDHEISAFHIILKELQKVKPFPGFYYWGSHGGFQILNKNLGKGTFIPVPYQIADCLVPLYEGIWFGYFPPACNHRMIDVSPEYWDQPYMPLLIKLAHKNGAKVALFRVNDKRSFMGFVNLVDIIITSEILEVGSRYSPQIN